MKIKKPNPFYKKNKNNSKGFTLIEAVVSVAVLGITIMFALSSINVVVRNKKSTQISTSINSIRQSIISTIKNPQSWNLIVQSNALMQCLLQNQDTTAPDCSTVSITPDWPQLVLMVYNTATPSNLFYDPTNPINGFSLKGIQTCSSYVALPAAGNPDCPLRADVRWRPICPAAPAPCRWPNIEVRVTFEYNPGVTATYDINPRNIELTIIRPVGYCPDQLASASPFVDPNDFSQWTATGSVSITANSFSKTAAGGLGDYGITKNIYSCNNYEIDFTYDIASSAAALDNIAQVCITSTTSTFCLYEWRQYQGSWYLYDGTSGVSTLVYTKPASTAFTSTTGLAFKIVSGSISFYSNGQRAYTFMTPRNTPYRVYFNPARSTFSSKIGDISFINLN